MQRERRKRKRLLGLDDNLEKNRANDEDEIDAGTIGDEDSRKTVGAGVYDCYKRWKKARKLPMMSKASM